MRKRWTIGLGLLVLGFATPCLAVGGPAVSDVAARQGGSGGAAHLPILADVNRDCVVDVRDLGAVLGAFGTPDRAADVNGDGNVDGRDQDMLLAVWGSTCGKRLTGDVNGDGRVDVNDLGRVLAAWGRKSPQTDFDGDGATDATDLAMLQAAWGRTLARRLLGDHTGNDIVDVNDLTHVLAHWDPATSPTELDLVLAQWGRTSGRDLLGDVNGDRVVDGVDQALVLAAWGTGFRQADVDGDGAVGSTDLNLVLAGFGNIAGRDLSGDVNGDWVVDAADRDLLLAVWGKPWAPADLDGSGRVGTDDLTRVLAGWGDTFGQQFTGDINGDCVVDVVDQKILLAFWGPGHPQADLNADGTTNVVDLSSLLGSYGNTCP